MHVNKTGDASTPHAALCRVEFSRGPVGRGCLNSKSIYIATKLRTPATAANVGKKQLPRGQPCRSTHNRDKETEGWKFIPSRKHGSRHHKGAYVSVSGNDAPMGSDVNGLLGDVPNRSSFLEK